jgi:putative ABC transport system substrate-binding protein
MSENAHPNLWENIMTNASPGHHASGIRRREFIAALGCALAALPSAAQAQQPAIPVVGFLGLQSPAGSVPMITAFRQGLNEAGFVEGRNVAIEYRSAEGRFDQLSALAAELIRRQVSVIFTNGGPVGVRAIQALTTSVPVVFALGEDPVKERLVASLNRPGGNATGFISLQNQLDGKRLALLRDAVPNAAILGFLVNPSHPNAQAAAKEAQAAAAALGRDLRVYTAATEGALETVFAAMANEHVAALLVSRDPNLFDWRKPIIALAARYAIPAIYDRRDFPAADGLMSYGANDLEAWRQGGDYVGRILKGANPADLPVQQSAKLDFVINLKTAKALGLEIPPGVLAIADEVIE